MSVMAAITLADGASTPVNHTFNPVTDSPATWLDSDAAILYKHQQKQLIVSMARAKNSSGVNRITVSMTLPTGGDGVAVPSADVARFSQVKCDFLLPAKSTKQERKDLRTLFMHALADAQLIDIVDELNSAW